MIRFLFCLLCATYSALNTRTIQVTDEVRSGVTQFEKNHHPLRIIGNISGAIESKLVPVLKFGIFGSTGGSDDSNAYIYAYGEIDFFVRLNFALQIPILTSPVPEHYFGSKFS